MEDKIIFEKLMKLAEERKDIDIPLGYVLDTIFAALEETYKNVPKEATKEHALNYVINTLLFSFIASFVCFGNEEEMKKVISDLFVGKKTKILRVNNSTEETKKN